MNQYRERYHRDLDELKTLTESLADQVSIAIDKAITALRDSNVDTAKDVIQGDNNVDEMNQKIEDLCTQLLALQQPMAKDLRQITGILKIGVDLERIGDLAVDIARITIKSQKIQMIKLDNMLHMAENSRRMLYQAMEALTNSDADMARQTTKWDCEIDGLYIEAMDMILKIIIDNPKAINEGSSLLMVNRHLERIGDHICNICESIVYMVEGKREHLN